MSNLTIYQIDRADTRAFQVLGDLWCRASKFDRSSDAFLDSKAKRAVYDGAKEALWPLAGTIDSRLVSMGFGIQVRENDGAGAPVHGHVLLRFIAVDEPFRNRGHGRAMVSAVMAAARAAGFSTAELWVAVSNLPALHLYEYLAFSATGRTILDEQGELMAHLAATL